jgi:hypothetical protein
VKEKPGDESFATRDAAAARTAAPYAAPARPAGAKGSVPKQGSGLSPPEDRNPTVIPPGYRGDVPY